MARRISRESREQQQDCPGDAEWRAERERDEAVDLLASVLGAWLATRDKA